MGFNIEWRVTPTKVTSKTDSNTPAHCLFLVNIVNEKEIHYYQWQACVRILAKDRKQTNCIIICTCNAVIN